MNKGSVLGVKTTMSSDTGGAKVSGQAWPFLAIGIAIMTKGRKSKSQRLARVHPAVVCLPLAGTETCGAVEGCWQTLRESSLSA